jgi:hypothetical protein
MKNPSVIVSAPRNDAPDSRVGDAYKLAKILAGLARVGQPQSLTRQGWKSI